jgi:hypothetical protein
LTEFLPVSSTGHLIIAKDLLGLTSQQPMFDTMGEPLWHRQATADHGSQLLTLNLAADTYIVVIQFGAIAAVAIACWSQLLSMLQGILGRDPAGRRLLLNVMIAFLPAAVIGLLVHDWIDQELFSVGTVISPKSPARCSCFTSRRGMAGATCAVVPTGRNSRLGGGGNRAAAVCRHLAGHQPSDDGDRRGLFRRTRSAPLGGVQFPPRLRDPERRMSFQDVQERRIHDPGIRISPCPAGCGRRSGRCGNLRSLFCATARSARLNFFAWYRLVLRARWRFTTINDFRPGDDSRSPTSSGAALTAGQQSICNTHSKLKPTAPCEKLPSSPLALLALTVHAQTQVEVIAAPESAATRARGFARRRTKPHRRHHPGGD